MVRGFQFLEKIAWGIICHAIIECHHAVLEPVGALLTVEVDGGEYRAIVFFRFSLDKLRNWPLPAATYLQAWLDYPRI